MPIPGKMGYILMRAKWDHPVLSRYDTCMVNDQRRFKICMYVLCTLTILDMTFAKGPFDTELFNVHWFATVVCMLCRLVLIVFFCIERH